MRTGTATVPLHSGHCPKWLFERMKRLSRGIVLAILEEFGREEVLKRLSDPVWFQSLGCVIGFDWNSSGLFTTTMGALKETLRGTEKDLGIFICGGKRVSRKTPQEIEHWGETLGWEKKKIKELIHASKMAAKVDSALIQDQFQIYAHNLVFTKSGQWTVIQQGMNTYLQKARRYHWLSSNLQDFIEEPHSGIISDVRLRPLNLTARASSKNRKISTELIREEPKTFLKDFKRLVQKKHLLPRRLSLFRVFRGGKEKNFLMRQKRFSGFTEIELENVEFHWHPVLKEKFDLKRLEKTIFAAHLENPENFEKLLALKGVGPKTIRALSLVSEIIYGAQPSYEDPARYSFAHGGKDGTPYFPRSEEMDATISILEEGIKKAKISNREKIRAQRRLNSLIS